MGNNVTLTETEFNAYRPHPVLVDHIERCRSTFGVARRDFRIVDWGCGRGALVLWLREQGYDAVGVDINPAAFEKSADLFRSKGHAAEACLHGLDSRGVAPFDDARFHFISSCETVEHLEDLDAVAAEWRRVTMPGGGGFHIYPPHHRIVEGHLFMPFVHWLPKAAPRRWLIALYVLVGVEPRWSPRLGWARRVRQYYDFSVNETFYRSPAVVSRCLAAHGFDAEFVDVEDWRPGRERAAAWFGLTSASTLVRFWYMNFGGDVGLATSLPTPASTATIAVHSRR